MCIAKQDHTHMSMQDLQISATSATDMSDYEQRRWRTVWSACQPCQARLGAGVTPGAILSIRRHGMLTYSTLAASCQMHDLH